MTTAAWGADGVWSAQLAVPSGATPGTYTIRVDDGESTVTRNVVIGRERTARPTGTPTERPATPTDRPTGTPTERPATPTDRPTGTPTERPATPTDRPT
ncbi:MAG: major cell surface glycoprotein, partial [Haloplanus sp.]